MNLSHLTECVIFLLKNSMKCLNLLIVTNEKHTFYLVSDSLYPKIRESFSDILYEYF